ncbi:hypothetical protein T439DRAFT_97445 [Meredithblackwellia eburnea MCA 4105]
MSKRRNDDALLFLVLLPHFPLSYSMSPIPTVTPFKMNSNEHSQTPPRPKYEVKSGFTAINHSPTKENLHSSSDQAPHTSKREVRSGFTAINHSRTNGNLNSSTTAPNLYEPSVQVAPGTTRVPNEDGRLDKEWFSDQKVQEGPFICPLPECKRDFPKQERLKAHLDQHFFKYLCALGCTEVTSSGDKETRGFRSSLFSITWGPLPRATTSMKKVPRN